MRGGEAYAGRASWLLQPIVLDAEGRVLGVRDKPAFRIKNRFRARNIWGIFVVDAPPMRRAAIVNARMAAVDAEDRIPRR